MKIEVQGHQPKIYTGDPSKWPDGWFRDVACDGVLIYKRGHDLTQFQFNEIQNKNLNVGTSMTYSCDYYLLPPGSTITITV